MGLHKSHGARSEKFQKPLDVAGQMRVAENMEYALKLAAIWTRTNPGRADDLNSVALEALVEASTSYDPSRRARFTSWAYEVITGRIRSWLDYERLRRTTVQLEPDMDRYPTDGPPASNRVESIEAKAEAKDRVDHLLSRLPRAQAKALRAVHGEGKSLATAGRELGKCKSRVGVLCQQGRARARELAGVPISAAPR